MTGPCGSLPPSTVNVLAVLKAADTPLSVREIVCAVQRSTGRPTSRQAAWRGLNTLAEHGRVESFRTGSGPTSTRRWRVAP